MQYNVLSLPSQSDRCSGEMQSYNKQTTATQDNMIQLYKYVTNKYDVK